MQGKACLLGPPRLRPLSASYLRVLRAASLPASALRALGSASLPGALRSLSPRSRSFPSRSLPWLGPRLLRSGSCLLSALRSLRLSGSLAPSGRLQTPRDTSWGPHTL